MTEKKNVVVLINTATFGTGAEELGVKLLNNYFFALTEVELKPRLLLLVNEGVKVALQGSPYVENLTALAQQGVKIAACGTCLDYYQVKDQLAVGEVTNMYTIAEEMLQADHVIKI